MQLPEMKLDGAGRFSSARTNKLFDPVTEHSGCAREVASALVLFARTFWHVLVHTSRIDLAADKENANSAARSGRSYDHFPPHGLALF
jgi:hypothetical protein